MGRSRLAESDGVPLRLWMVPGCLPACCPARGREVEKGSVCVVMGW